jgi:shikimate kinase
VKEYLTLFAERTDTNRILVLRGSKSTGRSSIAKASAGALGVQYVSIDASMIDPEEKNGLGKAVDRLSKV